MTEPLLRARGLDKSYRRGTERVHALRGVDLALYPGELVALVGPSGSGKSSLLGVLAGWDQPDAGELAWTLDGRARVPGAAPSWSELATVPQTLGLLEDLTVRENVALPVRLGLGRARGQEGRTEEMLALFGLAALAERFPSQTSLAQQQRAAVARALVLTPQLVLADEPSAHQDAVWVHDVLAALRQTVHDALAGCLVATHDPEAIRYADRVLHLIDGEFSERGR
jgi:ABC-type lipoprotein export system ATPase subunit